MSAVLQPIENDIGNIISDVGTTIGDVVQTGVDVTHAFEDYVAFPVEHAFEGLFKSDGPRQHKHKRARSLKPFSDGLIGVEPNPGPNPKPVPKKSRRGNKIGGRNASKGGRVRGLTFGGAKMSANTTTAAAASVGYVSNPKADHYFKGMGTKNVLGSPAHIFVGRCAVQNLSTNAGSAFIFQDASANQAQFMYLNPRICCQNAVYATPAGNCPIGVIAQAFRKYSFRRLRLHFQPTAAATSMSATVAYCFDPEVLTTSSLGASVMNYANFEASAYGPVWKASVLDCTPWLDRSKWYYGETPAVLATSLIAANAIQGTITLCGNTGPGASSTYGMFFMEFELALSELGPTEIYTAPAITVEESKDEKKEVETWVKIVEPVKLPPRN
jgi:hypothetical protein